MLCRALNRGPAARTEPRPGRS